jgi:hypothetical protein
MRVRLLLAALALGALALAPGLRGPAAGVGVLRPAIAGAVEETEVEIPCEGDSCQPLPTPPEDPQPGTLVPGPANPPPHYRKPRKHRHHKKHHRHRRRHRKRGRG